MSLAVSPGVRFRSIQDEAVVVLQGTSEVLALNPVGARVLALVAAGRSEAEMVDSITAEFEVEPALARQDVARFLVELLKVGVILRTEDER